MEGGTKTRLDAKGRIVIPEKIRIRLGLRTGTQFLVTTGDDDALILQTISSASMKAFDDLIRQARRQARKAVLRKSNVKDAIHRVRGRM